MTFPVILNLSPVTLSPSRSVILSEAKNLVSCRLGGNSAKNLGGVK
jgi:hypothetical protein